MVMRGHERYKIRILFSIIIQVEKYLSTYKIFSTASPLSHFEWGLIDILVALFHDLVRYFSMHAISASIVDLKFNKSFFSLFSFNCTSFHSFHFSFLLSLFSPLPLFFSPYFSILPQFSFFWPLIFFFIPCFFLFCFSLLKQILK